MRAILILALAGALLAPVPAVAQGARDCTVNLERVIHDHPLIPASVQIGTFEKTEPPYDLHVTASCGDDWLDGVQVKFRNMTNRTVSGVLLEIDFPDTEGPQMLQMGYQFRVGETPVRSTYMRDKTRGHVIQHPALTNPPRSEVVVALKPEYPEIKRFIETRQLIGTIRSVWIRILQVYFADGTVFNGVYQKPDPNDPTAYIRADSSEFRIGTPIQ
ncbi:MAG TPA: hypothetical protein VN661_12020 [Candidatus Acidoferrales bacterium]|nr:hypothetical protein [Candidatus Acidoferrales bacterium]